MIAVMMLSSMQEVGSLVRLPIFVGIEEEVLGDWHQLSSDRPRKGKTISTIYTPTYEYVRYLQLTQTNSQVLN